MEIKNKKLLIIVAVVVIVVLLLVTCSIGADNNNKGNQTTTTTTTKLCTHSFKKVSTKATCESGGSAVYECSLCNKTKTEYESALGHTTKSGTCSRCYKQIGGWEIDFYVDEFNNDTNQAYIKNSEVFVGVFSNSATTNSKLYARILVDEEDIAIRLWEYGSHEVKAYSTTYYDITLLDESGNKYYTTGTMYKNGNRIYLNDWKLVELLQKNSSVEIYIREDSDYGVNSTYLVEITKGNFNTVYSEYYYNYMQ